MGLWQTLRANRVTPMHDAATPSDVDRQQAALLRVAIHGALAESERAALVTAFREGARVLGRSALEARRSSPRSGASARNGPSGARAISWGWGATSS